MAQGPAFNGIGLNTYPGFLVAHRDDVKNMEAHTIGYEVSLLKKQITSSWASYYRKPEISLGIMFMYLGKPDLTGNVIAVLPSFSRKVGQLGHTEVRFKAGSGIGYLTKKFDAYTNRRNQSIGSHWNGAMQLYLNFRRYNPNEKYAYNLGIGITHFSNGSFRVPNLGVNMPSLQLGMETTSIKKIVSRKDSMTHSPYKFYFAYAFKERTLTKPRGFNIFNINATRLFARSSVKDWRLGSEVFLDKTHHYLDYPGESLSGLNLFEVMELGVFGGHQWLVGRVHFKADLGFYLYKPSRNKFFTYQRLGFDYYIGDHFFTTWNLKTHFGIADHFTWGLGYRL